MSTLLALTVGGSCAPVITAIRDYQWQEMYQIVVAFIEAGLKALKVRLDAPQFPQWESAQ